MTEESVVRQRTAKGSGFAPPPRAPEFPHNLRTTKRTQPSGGLSFDWPSVARTATTGLMIGLLLGVVGLYCYGGGPNNVERPAAGPLLAGIWYSVFGAGFRITEYWRAEGGGKLWLAWALSGGMAGAAILTIVETGLLYSTLGSDLSASELPGVLLLWLLVGPLSGFLVGGLLWSWDIS